MRVSFPQLALVGLLAGLCLLTQGSSAWAQRFALRGNSRPPSKKPTHLGMPALDKIEVSVSPTATGEALKLQQEIVEQFSRESFYPEPRKREYAWIAPRPADGQMGLWLNGWTGNIEKVTKTSDGWLVRVVVWPRLANGGHPVRLLENGVYAEEYNYKGGRLSFQKAIQPKHPGRPIGITW